MIYVSSDWHGFPLSKIQELLASAGFSDDDFLFVLGDVIDRGEHSVTLLKWLMVQPNVELLLGNHEDMLLSNDWLFDEITDESVEAVSADKLHALQAWQRNGGEQTIAALSKESPDVRADLLAYLRDCPLYDTVSVGDRDYLLVHAGLGDYRADKKISDYTAYELLWTRPYLTDRYSKEFTTVLGHTPTAFYGPTYRGRILHNDTWINVDTGAACRYAPCLLRLDDEKEFYL